ncbi:MAG: hypothetical protein LBG92_05660 [Prevotellaceae bacterium]|jgi:hypothetical protein|nr:hypothetical protein [Prevotellaceae bacterium]
MKILIIKNLIFIVLLHVVCAVSATAQVIYVNMSQKPVVVRAAPDEKSKELFTIKRAEAYAVAEIDTLKHNEWVKVATKAENNNNQYNFGYIGRNDFGYYGISPIKIKQNKTLHLRKERSLSASVVAKVGVENCLNEEGYSEFYLKGYNIYDWVIVVNWDKGGNFWVDRKNFDESVILDEDTTLKGILAAAGSNAQHSQNLLHYWILWLTLFYFALSFWGKNRNSPLLFALEYMVLMAIFVIELVYFGLQENGFEWCNWDVLGLWKALLGFAVSAVIIWIQFNGYFNIIRQIKLFGGYFNSFIGTLMLGIFFIIIFMLGAFHLIDATGWWIGVVLIAALVIQEIIIIVKLRRSPMMMIAALLFLPVGICGFLLTFLKFLGFVVAFAIVVLIVRSMMQGSGASPGNQGEPGMANNCKYFGNMDECFQNGDTIGEKCTLYYNGICNRTGRNQGYY